VRGEKILERRLSMKLLPIAGVLCAVAVLFYCAYTRSYEAVSVVILLVFFAYFLNRKSEARGVASFPSPTSGQVVRSPIREVAEGLACLVVGGLGVGIGLRVPGVQLGVALALTAAVTGILALVIFLLRTLNAWNSRA
jgi:hypothetical protein